MSSLEDTLPAYKEAYKLGYSLRMYGANHDSADYVKGDKILSVKRNADGNCTAQLHAYPYLLVHMEIPTFSFPNENFIIFERQLDMVLSWLACGMVPRV